jgi:putative FmdB family regulatory protein
MPVYDYACETCGPFATSRSIADFAAPCSCPDCGADAPRALARPFFPTMGAATRIAHATNERSRHEPRRHSAGCGCCKPASEGAAKSFPGQRPWMISH